MFRPPGSRMCEASADGTWRSSVASAASPTWAMNASRVRIVRSRSRCRASSDWSTRWRSSASSGDGSRSTTAAGGVRSGRGRGRVDGRRSGVLLLISVPSWFLRQAPRRIAGAFEELVRVVDDPREVRRFGGGPSRRTARRRPSCRRRFPLPGAGVLLGELVVRSKAYVVIAESRNEHSSPDCNFHRRANWTFIVRTTPRPTYASA